MKFKFDSSDVFIMEEYFLKEIWVPSKKNFFFKSTKVILNDETSEVFPLKSGTSKGKEIKS